MPRPSPVTKSIQYGDHLLTIETGEVARQASGAVMASLGDTVVLATVVADRSGHSDRDFFPPHRGLPGEDVRRRAHSRRVLSPGGPAEREGDPHLPPDRPTHASPVPQGVPERNADHGDGGVRGPGHRPGHSRDGRRVGRGGLCRHTVQRTDRRGPRGLLGRPVPPQSGVLRACRLGARSGRGRYPGSRSDGGVRSAGALRGSDARCGHVRPRTDAAGHRPHHRARGAGRPSGVELGPAGGGLDP